MILDFGQKEFPKHFKPIIEFLDLKTYYSLISNCKIAIFGSKRQHSGANIFFMLGVGAKVFLRPENNIYKHLKDKGVFVYNFNDITSIVDFDELCDEKKEHNRILIEKEFSKENEISAYKNFFKHE